MSAHKSYEESKRFVFYGLGLLALVTLIEVFFSLAGKGVFPGFGWAAGLGWVKWIVGLILISLSLYKAYFIIYEFMHLKYEVQGMALTILLPVSLLFWAMVAFFQEGGAWGDRRAIIAEFNDRAPTTAMPSVSPVERQSPTSEEEAIELNGGEDPVEGEPNSGVGDYD